MMSVANEIDAFARYYGFHYGLTDSAELVQDVSLHMERGLEGKSSSLPMLPAYLGVSSAAAGGKRVIALDAG